MPFDNCRTLTGGFGAYDKEQGAAFAVATATSALGSDGGHFVIFDVRDI